MPCHVLFVLGKKWSKATTVLHTFFSLLINWKVYFIADNEKCFWHTYTGNTWAWWKRSIYCVWRCRCLSCTNPLYLFWFLMHSMPEQFLGTYSMFHLMQVAQIAVRAVLQSSGQNCAGAERFYVHRDIYSSFVSEVTKIVKSVSVVSMSVLTCFMHRYLFSWYLQFSPWILPTDHLTAVSIKKTRTIFLCSIMYIFLYLCICCNFISKIIKILLI